MKNTVIFDLDGLLIDSEIISYQLYCDLAEKYGQSMSLEDYVHYYSGKTAEINMRTFIDRYGFPASVEEGIEFVDLRETEYLKKGVALKPGAEALLSYLKRKQYKIVLATSSTRERAVDVLDQNEIADFFDFMVFGAEVKRGKPYPDIFIKACEHAKEPPENCLVLEDSEAGIQAAYAAGIDVICIPDMKIPDIEFCKMTVEIFPSLKNVISWLENAI